jgi:hypothetical protein
MEGDILLNARDDTEREKLYRLLVGLAVEDHGD